MDFDLFKFLVLTTYNSPQAAKKFDEDSAYDKETIIFEEYNFSNFVSLVD